MSNAENLMLKILKLSGIEIGEKFNIIINSDTRLSYDNCYFGETVGGSISWCVILGLMKNSLVI